jgi:anthranilate phosphoribosyltransferase
MTPMATLDSLTDHLRAGRDLDAGEVSAAAARLASGEVPDASKAEFLAALASKGETAEEVAAFAREFRARAVNPGLEDWAARAVDIVGTGGDHAGAFNVSSLVVLVLACAGVPVMKHGNRGITSRCGSADLLAALGVDLEVAPARQRAAMEQLGYVFFFAPAYHPAFRHIGPVRKALAARGQRTIFNILGPLINPGRPAHILLGVYSSAWVPRIAGALESLGIEAGLVVHGILGPDKGVDELTTAGVTEVRGVGRLREVAAQWRAEDVGLPPAPFAELRGGDLPSNLALIDRLLAGRAPAGLVDTIALNAAVAMWICGRTASVAEGIGPAKELIVGGALERKIAATREFFRARP